MKRDLIVFRDGIEHDYPLIFASWLKGLYYGNQLYGDIPSELYYAVYHQVVEQLLKTAKVKIAALKEDPDVILGYSVYDGNTLHWVFVKNAWRGIGLGRDLIPPELSTITHLTKVGRAIWKSKHPTACFNPFLEAK